MLRAILFAVTIAIVAGIGFYFGRSSARVSASNPQPVRTWVQPGCRRPDAIASGATGVTALLLQLRRTQVSRVLPCLTL